HVALGRDDERADKLVPRLEDGGEEEAEATETSGRRHGGDLLARLQHEEARHRERGREVPHELAREDRRRRLESARHDRGGGDVELTLVARSEREHEVEDREVVARPREARAPGVEEHERSEEHTSELQSRENLVCRL